MPNPTGPTAAEGMSIAETDAAILASLEAQIGTTDPIVILGHQIGEHYRRAAAFEAQKNAVEGNPAQELRAEANEERERDIERLLCGQLSTMKATTLDGAALQIAEASTRIDSLFSDIDEKALPAGALGEIRAIARLLYSALAMVDAKADRRIAENAHDIFANPQCDPWSGSQGEEV